MPQSTHVTTRGSLLREFRQDKTPTSYPVAHDQTAAESWRRRRKSKQTPPIGYSKSHRRGPSEVTNQVYQSRRIKPTAHFQRIASSPKPWHIAGIFFLLAVFGREIRSTKRVNVHSANVPRVTQVKVHPQLHSAARPGGGPSLKLFLYHVTQSTPPKTSGQWKK